MSRPCVIVYERRGLWAAGIKRHLPREVRVRETRIVSDFQAELAASPSSLIVAELSRANLEPVLHLVAQLGDKFPAAAAVIVCPRELAAYEDLFREAGAVHFSTSPRTCHVLAELAVRHIARTPAARLSLAAQVWEWLPWE